MKLDGPNGPDTIEVGRFLGAGSFGQVFEAADQVSGARLAVKFPAVAFGDSAELAAFSNELVAAKELSHPHVIQVVFVAPTGVSDSPPYLAMVFASDGTLKDLLDRRRADATQLPLDQVRALCSQLLDGVAAINATMLHRDIKPDNILLDGGVVKVSDFGLSKLVGALTRSATFKGGQHLLYMAPEGWLGEQNAIQIDMYSTGLVMFEIATLAFAYKVPATWQVVEPFRQMHLFERAAAVSATRSDLPEAFDRFVAQLLAKRAVDRFPSWATARAAFDAAWGSAPTTAPGDESVKRLLTMVTRARTQAEDRANEARRREAERETNARIDALKRDELVADLRNAVAEVNRLGAADTVTVAEVGGRFRFSVQHVGTIELTFFDPLGIETARGSVRVAGFVVGPGGGGFNVATVRRSKDDPYGSWEAFAARPHPLRAIEVMGPQPFALTDAAKFERSFQNHLNGVGGDLYIWESLGKPAECFVSYLAECSERVARGVVRGG